jgi:hypothetical protein
MVAFDEEVFRKLDKDAKSRNISLQALLRAVVIPEWIRDGRRTLTNYRGMQRPNRSRVF